MNPYFNECRRSLVQEMWANEACMKDPAEEVKCLDDFLPSENENKARCLFTAFSGLFLMLLT